MTLLESLADGLSNITGRSVLRNQDVEALQENAFMFDEFKREAADFAENVLDKWPYSFNGRTDLTVEHREKWIHNSRQAYRRDPLAGAEIDTKTNFAFGRGISKPKAFDEKVQEIIDEAWDDGVNVEALTGFDAQRALSVALATDGNLYAVAFTKNGRVRVSFIEATRIMEIITDPENEHMPLWYAVRKRDAQWDFETDQWKPNLTTPSKVEYYRHWRNDEDAEDSFNDGDSAASKIVPPKEKQADGVVFHLRINRHHNQRFGQPPMERTLRFYSSMNRFVEARISMALASAQLIAKKVVGGSGTPRDVTKQANKLLNRTGDIGGGLRQLQPPPQLGQPQVPLAPASWMIENEALRTEPLNLNSGAGNAAQDAQTLRAPIAAATGMGQHYFGDSQNAGSLASATALELPTMKMIDAWQETFEQLYRWFVEMAIETAVKGGRLGEPKLVESDYHREWKDLRLAEDKAEMEKRTKIDLGFEFQMPYPGRRNLPDIVSTITQIAQAFDPNGENNHLRRELLRVLFTMGFERDDPQKLIDEIWPEDGFPTPPPDANMQARVAALTGQQSPPQGGQTPSDQKPIYGEKKSSSAANLAEAEAILKVPGGTEYISPELRPYVDGLMAMSAEQFERLVAGPARAAVTAGGRNGNSPD